MLKTFGIRVQILSVGAVALAGFLLVGAVYFVSTRHLENLQAEQRRALDGRQQVTSIKYEFLNARRREKDFLIRMDNKYVDQHKDVVDQIRVQLAQLAEGQRNLEFQENVAIVRKGFDAYVRQFGAVVDSWNRIGLGEEQGLRGQLRGSVHAVETRLKNYGNDRLTVIMLMMRRHEKDFLMRLDAKYVDRMGKRQQEFQTALEASAIPIDDRGQIEGLMSSYLRDFRALAALRLQVNEETARLSALFAASEPQFQSLLAESRAELEQTLAAVDANAERTRTVMILAMAGIALAVLSLCLIIGRGISRPVRSMVAVMTDLARGNKQVDIPATDYRNGLSQRIGGNGVCRCGL